MLHRIAAMTLAIALLAGCGGGSTAESGAGAKKIKIAVIPKGTTHEYWKSIHAGAVRALEGGPRDADGKSSVEIIWKGPLKEDESTAQIAVVEDMINSGVSGIVLAPNDANALSRIVESAESKGIPVVIIDSDVNTDKYHSFVATDNEKGGYMGGKELAQDLGGKGKVIMLRYEEGSASTEKREAGFLRAMAETPGISVVSKDQFGGATSDSAQKAAENLIAGFKNPDGTLSVDGIFCPNESTAFGMLRALEGAKVAGKVKFVGFDASEVLLAGLKAGEIQALVLQDPVRMGDLGVKTMLDILDKKTVEKRIDTGVHLATLKNIDDPEIKDLLNPPLAKYLDQK